MNGQAGGLKTIDIFTLLFFQDHGREYIRQFHWCFRRPDQKYLKKPIIAQLDYLDSDIPPTAKVEGLDLVTEGVITMSKVVEYAKDYLEENRKYSQWGYKRDGASMIARMLFEEATDINFFVGRAVNPAHQNPNLPINFNIKMQLVENLCTSLEKMGKKVKVSYF